MLRKISPGVYIDPERVTHLVEGHSHSDPVTRIHFASGESVDVPDTVNLVAEWVNDALRGTRGRH